MAYAAVTVEGGFFPGELLDRIATGQVAGQRPEDFGLARGSRLSDEFEAAFSAMRRLWDVFQRRLGYSRESPTTLTREAWMGPLLERLGYQLSYQRGAAQVGTDTYTISHRAVDHPSAPPVHIVGIDQSVDRRDGARRSSHAIVQEYLNRSDCLWGIVADGARLRLLRDSARLSRPTYLEFDLRAMVGAGLYSDFVLFYRLLHRSRLPGSAEDAHECLLERYYQDGIEEGGRVREHLREGVQAALRVLGTAFLSHPGSQALRDAFASQSLTAASYYRQLLRLVYRLLFLMVAEERRLIVSPEADLSRQRVYQEHYAMARLRARSQRPFADDHYSDVWQGLCQTFRLFSDGDAAGQLGLSPLNGELFGPSGCPDLEEASCENASLLHAIYRLSTFWDGRVRRRVNYAALDVEELGSVYESLLEYQPFVPPDGSRFELEPGTERRQTGSYYTPPELVRELIDAALVPVMAERLASAKTPEEREHALLSLRVCDPAAGSGHFLLAAGRRIALDLSRVRTGEDEPAPDAYRAALRDVIRTCLYAVDKNPLAVDLCKVALWIEGHNAGLPLTFLDHHVKWGDSLVGVADLSVLDGGIPDDAYKRSDPTQRSAARAFRARNKADRGGRLTLLDYRPDDRILDIAVIFDELARAPDDTVQRVAEKAARYEAARGPGGDWWAEATACQLWTAPFFLDLADQASVVPTTATLRTYMSNPGAGHGQLVGAAWGEALNGAHPFFHWPLEFPDVMVNGGFDVVLGNPPFMAGTRISTVFGERYFRYLTACFSPTGNRADLCAYFLRRNFLLLRGAGRLGMVATNSIAQGDTREGGLAVVSGRDGTIGFARRFVQWPGPATVEVNLVGVSKGSWAGSRRLDGAAVAFISSRLDTEAESEPRRIGRNGGLAIEGSYPLGEGFLLGIADAAELIDRDPRNSEVLFPYLTGEDLNSRPDQAPSRWVIQFDERTEEEARSYPEIWRIVNEKIRPERAVKNRTKYPRMVNGWWKHWNNRQAFYRDLARGRVLVRSFISEQHALVFAPTSWLLSKRVAVFRFDDYYHFSLLQSNVHEAWVRKNASTLRTDVAYTLADCFDTFPFPQQPPPGRHERAAEIGGYYHEHRRQTMLARNLGLTKTYNLFHNPACTDADIQRLRELHAELDRAILACYGWDDLDPGHGFHQNERGQTRFTISSEGRREMLRRLLEMNLQIAAKEASGRV